MAYAMPPMPMRRPMPAQANGEPDADDAGKMTHAEVGYAMAKPGGDRCDHCKFYERPNDCELVQSPIYPAGWCRKFQSAGASADQSAAQPAVAGAPTLMVAAPANPAAAPSAAPAAPPADHLAHGRAIAGAKALHAVGHISRAERDRHVAKSRAAIGRKPFGSFAPEVER